MSKTAFFAGSFDPPTLGHVDLVRRSLLWSDRLVVGVGQNADKQGWLPVELRIQLLREVLPAGVEVVAFEGLAVSAARAAGAQVLVRGVRNAQDAAAELQMSFANKQLDEGIETVLLPASLETAHISSRLVREVHRSGGDTRVFLPEAVAAALKTVS